MKWTSLLDYIKPVTRVAAAVVPNPALAIGAVIVEAIDKALDDHEAEELDERQRAEVYGAILDKTETICDGLRAAIADGKVTEEEHRELLALIHDEVFDGDNL